MLFANWCVHARTRARNQAVPGSLRAGPTPQSRAILDKPCIWNSRSVASCMRSWIGRLVRTDSIESCSHAGSDRTKFTFRFPRRLGGRLALARGSSVVSPLLCVAPAGFDGGSAASSNLKGATLPFLTDSFMRACPHLLFHVCSNARALPCPSVSTPTPIALLPRQRPSPPAPIPPTTDRLRVPL